MCIEASHKLNFPTSVWDENDCTGNIKWKNISVALKAKISWQGHSLSTRDMYIHTFEDNDSGTIDVFHPKH